MNKINFSCTIEISKASYIRCPKTLPTVPPNSITQTSAGRVCPSTGTEDTDCIHCFISSVTWGTTWINSSCKSVIGCHIWHSVHTWIRQGGYLDRLSKIVTLPLLLNDRLKKGIHCLEVQVTISKPFPGGVLTWYIFPVVMLFSLVRVTSKKRS